MVTKMKKIKVLAIGFLTVCNLFTFAQESKAAGELKKKEETKISEVITTDSLPSSELVQRAVNWVKVENVAYVKTSGVTTGTKAECTVAFIIKPKELNPACDYTGKITMKVVVDCKDNKYKYTVSHLKHISKSGKTSGGSIDNVVPECGSMIMTDLQWKKLKGEALTKAGIVLADLKEGMKVNSKDFGKEEW